MSMKSNRKSASKWDSATERVLIAIWKDRLPELRGCRKNSHIMKEIANEMQKQGFQYTVIELQNKMHNLSARYRREKRDAGTSGGAPSEWELYNEMHALLMPFKSYNTEDLVHESIIVNSSSTKYKKRIQWSPEAMELLVEIWGENYDELKNTRCSSQTFEKISGFLTKNGYPFSLYEVKVKVHNLKNKYREERKKIVLQSEPSDWPLFEQIHEIYGKHKNYDFEVTDGNSRTNFTFEESDTLMEELVPEEEYLLVPIEEKRQEDIFKKQNGLPAHNSDSLNRDQTSCSEENTTTQDNFHSTRASKRFKSQIEEDDVAENSSNPLSNSKTNTNFTIKVSDSLMPEKNNLIVENRQKDMCIEEEIELQAHNHDSLNRKRASCPDKNTTTQEINHSTKASKRFKSRIEEDDEPESSGSTLRKLSDTVNDVVSFIIKTDAGKSRNDAFLKLMDSYLLKLPERSQDLLKMEILDMVFNKIKHVQRI